MKKIKLFGFSTLLLIVLSLCFMLFSCNDTPDAGTTNPAGTTTQTDAPGVVLEEISVTATPGEYKVSLTWGAVDGADSYAAYVSRDDGVSFELISESEYRNCADLKCTWGTSYKYIVRAYTITDGDKLLIGESKVVDAASSGVRVNDYATKDDIFRLFCKDIVSKSDGYAAYINGEIYLVDGGLSTDNQIKNFLLSLREEYMGELYEKYAIDRNYKLAINLIVSHFHTDHVSALTKNIIPNAFFTIEDVYVGAVPTGTFTDKHRPAFLNAIKSRNANTNVYSVDFAENKTIKFQNSDAVLDLYAAPIDWSITVPGDSTTGYLYVKSKHSDVNTLVGNFNSMWAKFTYGSSSFLFTGDTYDTSEAIDPFFKQYGQSAFDVDVLKYIHHGLSRFSAQLYVVTTPKYTVFSDTNAVLSSNAKAKNSISMAVRYGDLFILEDGALTFSSDGTTLTYSGITPRYTKN